MSDDTKAFTAAVEMLGEDAQTIIALREKIRELNAVNDRLRLSWREDVKGERIRCRLRLAQAVSALMDEDLTRADDPSGFAARIVKEAFMERGRS